MSWKIISSMKEIIGTSELLMLLHYNSAKTDVWGVVMPYTSIEIANFKVTLTSQWVTSLLKLTSILWECLLVTLLSLPVLPSEALAQFVLLIAITKSK